MFIKNRLKSYLTGLICLLFTYLFISSLTPPVRAALTCTNANVVCRTNIDCETGQTCTCNVLLKKYCTKTAPTNTPIPTKAVKPTDTPIPTPTRTPTPRPPTRTPTPRPPTSTPVPGSHCPAHPTLCNPSLACRTDLIGSNYTDCDNGTQCSKCCNSGYTTLYVPEAYSWICVLSGSAPTATPTPLVACGPADCDPACYSFQTCVGTIKYGCDCIGDTTGYCVKTVPNCAALPSCQTGMCFPVCNVSNGEWACTGNSSECYQSECTEWSALVSEPWTCSPDGTETRYCIEPNDPDPLLDCTEVAQARRPCGGGVQPTAVPGDPPVDGVCFENHDYCFAGNSEPQPIDDTEHYHWTCFGTNGGSDALCSENKPVVTPTTTPPSCVESVCNPKHDGCDTGVTGWTAEYTDPPDPPPARWEWWCNGSNAAHPGGGSGICDIKCLEIKRPLLCSSSSESSSTISPSNPITITINSNTPLTHFWLQFYNIANSNETIQFVAGTNFTIVKDAASPTQTMDFTVNYSDIDKIDTRTGLKPTNIQVNGYFRDPVTGNTSAADIRCVQQFTVALSEPVGTCGTFNNDPDNPATPITWSWGPEPGLQVKDKSFTDPDPLAHWWWNRYNPPGVPPLTLSGIRPGPPQVCARTTFDFNTFSSETCITCPIPPYPPPATIQGNLQQRSGTGCYIADLAHTFDVTSISSDTNFDCVTSDCHADPGNTLPNHSATDYNCVVTFDGAACLSQVPPVWPTSAEVTLTDAIAVGYTFVGWTPNGSCTPPNNSKTVIAGTTADQPLTFNSPDNWIKLKSSSFNGISTTGITIPAFATSYDLDDDGLEYFISGIGGSVLNTTVLPNTDPLNLHYSNPNNWYDSSYVKSFPIDPFAFYKSKQSTEISALNEITDDGIYVWKKTVDFPDIINGTSIPNKNFVLISTEKPIKILSTNFNPNPTKSVAIVADSITFGPTTETANGIFIAKTVNTGSNSDLGLKIIGNLIAQSTLTNNRSWSNTSRPGLFIVFDPAPYISLLPYLSTARYEWRQIQ